MKKVISAGHICLDITPVFSPAVTGKSTKELFLPGHLIQTENVKISLGGSVANTGLALQLLGADVTLLCKAGTDELGDLIEAELKKRSAKGLIRDRLSTTSYSVVLAVPGQDRIFLHCPGANSTFSERDIPDSVFEGCSLLHFGYPPLMKKMYANSGEELKTLFSRAHKAGCAVSLDMAAIDPSSEAGQQDWQAFLENILPETDLFLPSFEELCFMLDRNLYERLSARGGDMISLVDPERDAAPLAEKCLAMGCGVCVVKCGTGGLYYACGGGEKLERAARCTGFDVSRWQNRKGLQPCFAAEKTVSATGCGDTAIAAFLAALLEGRGPEECARLAAAEGACCVTAVDALSGLETLEALDARIRKGWKTYRMI